MNKVASQNNRGFSLVETLVAISILMISIAGPMVLVGNGIRSSAFARDQITAFYLAQDAIEALRYIRDVNRIEKVLSSNPELVQWNDLSYYSNCTETSPCGIDTNKVYTRAEGAISPDTDDDHLLIDDTTGIYGYDTGTETVFRRYIAVTPVDSKEIEVIVTVDWSSGTFTRRFSIRENLFYWY